MEDVLLSVLLATLALMEPVYQAQSSVLLTSSLALMASHVSSAVLQAIRLIVQEPVVLSSAPCLK